MAGWTAADGTALADDQVRARRAERHEISDPWCMNEQRSGDRKDVDSARYLMGE